ncbi:MAG: SPOR domain-containing protein [Kiloniellaceae bacterium]
MTSEPGRGRDGDDDDLSAAPPPFSDEGMRRIIYGQDRGQASGRTRDGRSTAFADDTAELAAGLRGRRSLVPIVTALAAVVCFGAIVWYAYSWGTGQMAGEELPVVRAEPMPERVRPEQPGGMDVPHQGIAVLNEGTEGDNPQTVERLLPRPEIPAPPEPLAPQVPQTALSGSEDSLPEPIPEAPLMADESDADVTEPPALAEEPTAESEAAQLADDGISRPIPKPDGGVLEDDDQIAALLEQPPLETSSGTVPPPAPPAATQTAAVTTGDVVLQLSSVKSEAAAAQEWNRLKAAHPGLLGRLPLALETAQVQGATYYRVQTGPFPSRSAAAEVCAQLKSRNQDCLVKQR